MWSIKLWGGEGSQIAGRGGAGMSLAREPGAGSGEKKSGERGFS
jgi:hypothetical protein